MDMLDYMSTSLLMYVEKLHAAHQVLFIQELLGQDSFASWTLGCIRTGQMVVLRVQLYESGVRLASSVSQDRQRIASVKGRKRFPILQF